MKGKGGVQGLQITQKDTFVGTSLVNRRKSHSLPNFNDPQGVV